MEKELIVKFQCTAAECDAQRELSLLSLASHIIETATAHADSLGIGNGAMPGSGWVLARLTIEMQRYPKALEDYSIITWVEGWNRGSGVIPWQSYPKMIDKRYMKNGRSDTPCS